MRQEQDVNKGNILLRANKSKTQSENVIKQQLSEYQQAGVSEISKITRSELVSKEIKNW